MTRIALDLCSISRLIGGAGIRLRLKTAELNTAGEPQRFLDTMSSMSPDQDYASPPLHTEDQMMDGADDFASSTPTGGHNNGYGNGNGNGQAHFPRHQQPQPLDYARQNFSPPPDADPNARYASPNMYPQQQQQPMSTAYQDQNARTSQQAAEQAARNKNSVVIKVGMVGDAQIGKTSLMVKYVEGSWDEDYIQTLGVNFMEKTISIRNTEITFSIWDLGGQREFVNMLPLVCNDAVAILFMFDLTRKSTLNSIKEWYRQGRGFNKTAIPFLVGTKYDHFVNFPREDQEEISNQVCSIAPKSSVPFQLTGHPTGTAVCKGHESESDLQQHESQHQCSKGQTSSRLSIAISILTPDRYSRLSFPRHSISNARSQRLKMLENHCCCISR